MAPTPCQLCHTQRALILRPKNHQRLCKTCFIETFEREIHETIVSHKLFAPGERVAIGASGGKDSTVLASVLCTLNERHGYGLDLVLLSIDEGITGYRDDSLETVKRNAVQYGLPLKIVGYAQLYGWTMDQVVAQVGKRGNCTYCGVFRRQALDRGAEMLEGLVGSGGRVGKVDHVVTGHNADDIAETVLMNLLRGDLPRLSRATSITTSSPSSPIKRSKPLKYAYEKEIVLYAHHKKLDYFSTECIYSPEAFRGSARALIKQLERIRPSTILDVVRSGEDMARLVPVGGSESMDCGGSGKNEVIREEDGEDIGACGNASGRSSGGEMADMERRLGEADAAGAVGEGMEVEVNFPTPQHGSQGHDRNEGTPRTTSGAVERSKKPGRQKGPARTEKRSSKQTLGQCERCGYISSQTVCKACTLLEGLNKTRPRREVEVGIEEEDLSSSLMRRMERVTLAGDAG